MAAGALRDLAPCVVVVVPKAAAAACFSCSIAVIGQTVKKDTTLNRTVVVEKEYNPDIKQTTI